MARLAERPMGPRASAAVLPVASLENHGILPLGSDVLIAECVASRLEAAIPERKGVTIAPVIPYSTAVEHVGQGYTVSIRPPVFVEYLADVLRGLSTMARAVLVAVFHGGAYSASYLASRMVRSELKGYPIAIYNFWDAAARVLSARFNVRSYPIHADPVEASILLACGYTRGIREVGLEEVLAAVTARSRELRQVIVPPWIGLDYDGFYPSDLVPANRELGEEIIKEAVEDMTALIDRLLGLV